MKIHDLLEDLIGTMKTQKTYNGTLGQKSRNYNTMRKALGSGHFASVKPDPNDPHLVKKHSKRAESSIDGYNAFIEYLINHDLMDNIHFPKIYNITAITDKHGNKIHTYKMEKLIPFEEANRKELEFFIHKTFNEKGIKEILESCARHGTSFVLALGIIISDCAYGDFNLNNIIDDSFREAMETIKVIARDTPFVNIDIKTDNMMWRRTPHGLVLVFTDPIS